MQNLLFILFGLVILVWLAIELYTAPFGEETDEGFRITKKGRKLSDLFKKTKK